MASKVLVPGVPFASLQGKVKKTTVEPNGSGLYISGDPAARIAHLEHSVRFLQEQHRLMLSGLHAEIESLRERNRDLQFQLIFNKEPAKNSPTSGDDNESLVSSLRQEIERLEREATTARGEAAACAHDLLRLQRLCDEQANKLRSLEEEATEGEEGESAGALRARLGEAERLVRRLRADAERQRREVLGGAGVTNLLFDGAPHHAHLQCMKSSLMRAGAVDAFGFPALPAPYLHTADFWREPLREEYSMRGGGRHRRPNTLPALAVLQQQPRPPTYTQNLRARGYTDRVKKTQILNGESHGKSPEETDHPRINPVNTDNLQKSNPEATYPELKIVVTKIIPHGNEHNNRSCDENLVRKHRHAPIADHLLAFSTND